MSDPVAADIEPTVDTPPKESLLAGSLMLLGLVACLAGVIGVFVASGWLVAVLLIGGVGALGVGYLLTEVRRWPFRALIPGALAVATAGGVAAVFVPSRLIGALLAAGGLAALIAAAGVHRFRDRRRALGFALGIAVLLPLGGLGMASAWVHSTGGFVRHYGTSTTVTLPSTCVYLTGVNRWQAPTRNVVCRGATWQVDGAAVTGTLQGTATELALADLSRGFGLNAHVKTATAYAFRDEAFTPGASRPSIGPIAALGILSPWFALGLPLTLVAWFLLRRTDRANRVGRPGTLSDAGRPGR
jgi:hypothetical protein